MGRLKTCPNLLSGKQEIMRGFALAKWGEEHFIKIFIDIFVLQ